MINLSQLIGFDWDDGNTNKNWTKHRVDYKECEEIFFDENKKEIRLYEKTTLNSKV